MLYYSKNKGFNDTKDFGISVLLVRNATLFLKRYLPQSSAVA